MKVLDKLKYLYHATTQIKNVTDIMSNGFNTEETYFCTKVDHAAMFMDLYHGKGVCYVLEIDVSNLNMNKLEVSDDHNPDFFPKDLKAYVYKGVIPKGLVNNVYTVTSENDRTE